ncbi:hypothetical protein pben1_p52 [Paracoccus phage vB_PbeS_Pben1]|nr:hypothetical protein pben1_p52 [Paracoccus phage vB_PbeS_Pben1]
MKQLWQNNSPAYGAMSFRSESNFVREVVLLISILATSPRLVPIVFILSAISSETSSFAPNS